MARPGHARGTHFELGLLAAALAVLAAAAPAAAQQCGGADDLCLCMVELARGVEGGSVDQGRIARGVGTPAGSIFSRGGSQNIPVVCQAAKYYADHDPSWFLEYVRVQEDPQPPGFLGTEVLSPLYMQSILGSMIAVRAHAADRGHFELVAAADGWLKAVWALMALATADAPFASGTIVQRAVDEYIEANRSYTAGVSVPAAGSRADSQGQVGMYSLLHPLMSLALDWFPRRYTASLRVSPGFYGGLLAATASLGFEVREDGQVQLDSHSPSPERLGLSRAEQETLARFVASGGMQGLGEVLTMLGDRRPSCDITFLRTTDGLTSWFGTSDTSQRICNRNKGPLYAATFDAASRHVTWLHPNVMTNPAEGGASFRRGGQICAALDDGGERCIAVIGGMTVYEVAWTRTGGATVVDGIASATLPQEGPGDGDEGSGDSGVGDEVGPEPPEAPEPPEESSGAEDEAAEETLEIAGPAPAVIFGSVHVVDPSMPADGETDELEEIDDSMLDELMEDELVGDEPTTETPTTDEPAADERATDDGTDDDPAEDDPADTDSTDDDEELPAPLHLEGRAEGGDPEGESTSCRLDLAVELLTEVRRSEGAVEYTGVVNGRVTKSVLAGETETSSHDAKLDGEELTVRVRDSGEIELVIPSHLESENPFLRELGSFTGSTDADGTIRGEWTCAPFELDDVETESASVATVTAQGNWVSRSRFELPFD